MTSRHAARELAALGYTNIMEYPGGKADWVAGGLPLER
jgi:rhodanese-related sulfurtransferase